MKSSRRRRLFLTPYKFFRTGVVEDALNRDTHIWGGFFTPGNLEFRPFASAKMTEELAEMRKHLQSVEVLHKESIAGEIADVFAVMALIRGALAIQPPADTAMFRNAALPEAKWKQLLGRQFLPEEAQELIGLTEYTVRELMRRPSIGLTMEDVAGAEARKKGPFQGWAAYAQAPLATDAELCDKLAAHPGWTEYPLALANPETRLTRKAFKAVTAR